MESSQYYGAVLSTNMVIMKIINLEFYKTLELSSEEAKRSYRAIRKGYTEAATAPRLTPMQYDNTNFRFKWKEAEYEVQLKVSPILSPLRDDFFNRHVLLTHKVYFGASPDSFVTCTDWVEDSYEDDGKTFLFCLHSTPPAGFGHRIVGLDTKDHQFDSIECVINQVKV